jgi:hypothetical protein
MAESSLPPVPPPGSGSPEDVTQQALSDAGKMPDRNQFTRAGRALQKHLSRPGSARWERLIHQLSGKAVPTTAQDYNLTGQAILEYMIGHLEGVWSRRHVFSSGRSIEVRLPGGLGARWDDKQPPFFRTFLD